MNPFSFFRTLLSRPGPEKKDEFIFFGLGNPGKKYLKTRHNIGFRVIDSFNGCLSNKKRLFFSECAATRGLTASGTQVVTMKPHTFMNRSGIAVAAAINAWKFSSDRCLVVVDDFNLPLGTTRLRRSGSHGGHNGLKSIIGLVGENFPRLRIGIGPLPPKTDIIEFVLGDFSEGEEKAVSNLTIQAGEILKTFAAEGVDAAMNKYN